MIVFDLVYYICIQSLQQDLFVCTPKSKKMVDRSFDEKSPNLLSAKVSMIQVLDVFVHDFECPRSLANRDFSLPKQKTCEATSLVTSRSDNVKFYSPIRSSDVSRSYFHILRFHHTILLLTKCCGVIVS